MRRFVSSFGLPFVRPLALPFGLAFAGLALACAEKPFDGGGESEAEAEAESEGEGGPCDDNSDCEFGQACVDGACRVTACAPGLPYCDGDAARMCNEDGSEGEVIEMCAGSDVCNGGACISACDLAKSQYSFVGCEYYAVDSDNNADDGFAANDPLQYDIILGNPSLKEMANIEVFERTGGDWAPIYTASVPTRGVQIIPTTCSGGGGFGGGCQAGNLREDRHPEDTTVAEGYAFRVESDIPIFAYQFNSDDLDGSASSSGATILMPKAALDRQYYALAMPQIGQERSWVEVVGMSNGTSVNVRVPADTVAGGGIGALGAGDTATVAIDDGDVLQISSASAGGDLSGTYVEATAPVAVFAGAECARVGGGTCNGSDFGNGGDHVEEAMMPLITWGKQFAAAHVRHPQQETQNQATWKIVAWKDGTDVTFEAGPDTTGLPAGGLSLDEGDVATFTTNGTNGHFFVDSTEAIQMLQVMHGETATILVVPVEQYLDDYVFIAPPFFTDTLTVARPAGSEVTLDEAAIPGAWADAGGGYEVIWYDTLSDGSHQLTATSGIKGMNPGLQVAGMDANCSYGYLGGLNAQRINPIGDAGGGVTE